MLVLLEARSVSGREGLSGRDGASMQLAFCFSAQCCPERSDLVTHLRRLLRSSLAESAAARALMKCIHVASMLLANSKFGTKAQSALGCTAGLTTWTDELPEIIRSASFSYKRSIPFAPKTVPWLGTYPTTGHMMCYKGGNTPSSAAAAA